MRGLGDPDVFLPTDLGVRHGLAAARHRPPTVAERWRRGAPTPAPPVGDRRRDTDEPDDTPDTLCRTTMRHPIGPLTLVAADPRCAGSAWHRTSTVARARCRCRATSSTSRPRPRGPRARRPAARRVLRRHPHEFDLPLAPAGTPFQLAAWRGLTTIPYGETVSYGEQARRSATTQGAGRRRGQRAQPDPDLVPCHRVVGTTAASPASAAASRRRPGCCTTSAGSATARRPGLCGACRTHGKVARHVDRGAVPNVYVLPDQRLVECGVGDDPAARRCAPASRSPTRAAGGRSCSTCRVLVVEGGSVHRRTTKERAIAERLGFSPEFRLACQTQGLGDVTVRRLVLDDDDIELADIRPELVAGGTRPAHWAFGGSARRRARPQPIGEEMQRGRPVRRHPRLHRRSPKRCCRTT